MKYFIINGLYLNKDFSSLSEEPDEDDIFYQNLPLFNNPKNTFIKLH
jgi:hypothetical protein